MENTPTQIGPYTVLKSLGKGGMGEVFLVYDSICQRKIALKKILPELSSHEIIRQRFLREAKFAAQLSHPCILPIFSIDSQQIYYTMPYIEGETLKEIFKSTLEKEKMGLSPHELGVSIPALTRVFLSVCQAMASASSKGFLHRDLKPENIMVGKYGEVFLLDWGIASHSDLPELDELNISFVDEHLTRPGKVLGTVNYMSPERALKSPASLQSEIYSLGVILYLILTLKYPFVRKNLQHFRKVMQYEKLVPPEELAPYRDIPKQLSLIAQKCLQKNPEDRYQTLNELIFDLENYIQGRPEWIPAGTLNIMRKEDWEFQENILLSPQVAISSVLDSLEWVGLMHSKKSFSGNFKLEFDLMLPEEHEGFGLLMCVPEPSDRKGLEDGYCLWISNCHDQRIYLYRSNAEILSISQSGILSNVKTSICIEKIDHSLLVYISGVLKLHYISHIPLVGTHIGLLYKNPDFHLSPLHIFSGSPAVMINCLSIPDAFFSSKNFDQAYNEYKKIASSLEGRSEGREAQFRAGLSLLEKGKREKNKKERESLYDQATQEFEKLRSGIGSPLEYLGKSLIYYCEEDYEEEIKCLELVLRKFPHHPLIPIIKEQIIFRLHETSKLDKEAAYRFSLLCLMHLKEIFSTSSNQAFLSNLIKHRPHIFFINQTSRNDYKEMDYHLIALQLAFLLNKPFFIIEIYNKVSQQHFYPELFNQVVFSLLCLKNNNMLINFLQEQQERIQDDVATVEFARCLRFYLENKDFKDSLQYFKNHLPPCDVLARSVFFLMTSSFFDKSQEEYLSLLDELDNDSKKTNQHLLYLELKIELLLMLGKTSEIQKTLSFVPEHYLKDINSPFYFLNFCFQAFLQGFENLNKLHNSSYLLFDKQSQKTFFWEKVQKYEKLRFYYYISHDDEKFTEISKRLAQLLHQNNLN